MLKKFSEWLFIYTHDKELKKISRVSKLISLKAKSLGVGTTDYTHHTDVATAMIATLSTLGILRGEK